VSAGRVAAGLILATVFAACLGIGPARAQGVVLSNSDPVVTINSNFAGRTVTLFGNIEPGTGSVPLDGPYDIVVLVRGPANDRVVRAKDRQFGLLLNADHATYERLPGYYAVLSSRPLDALLSRGLQSDPRMSLAAVAAGARVEEGGAVFDPELIRLMAAQGLFMEQDRGVAFLSPTTFAARVTLPSNVPNGLFLAQALVIVDGGIAGSSSTSFAVRTEGFERFLAVSARNHPIPYGLAAVFIAIATGWMGGVLFRR
jgi:uncharacterized protein (TIGR02186 family)